MKKFHCPMSELSVKERLEIAQEVKLLAHLSHVNIIKFYDKCVAALSCSFDDHHHQSHLFVCASFVEKGVMHILMEYATGGTLDKKIAMRDGELIDEDQIWEWFVQIVMALRYVHSWYGLFALTCRGSHSFAVYHAHHDSSPSRPLLQQCAAPRLEDSEHHAEWATAAHYQAW